MADRSFSYPIWTRGDLDGFFGLMVDNLVQVLTIITLCTFVAGIPAEMVNARILPGVAVSLLVGNIFYGLQAHYVARRDRNAACTALPYGINTPTIFAFIFFIMGPVYRAQFDSTHDAAASADVAWKAGLLACLVTGLVEFSAAFFAETLRRITPRAALLGALAAIGITFVASDFAFRIYTHPLVGLLPLAALLLAYFGRFRFPLGLPGGLVVICAGTGLAWIASLPEVVEFMHVQPLCRTSAISDALRHVGLVLPHFFGDEILSVISNPDLAVRYLTISVPMGLICALGSLQNIESAEAGGDKFATMPSLAVNGLGTIAAALFGSCFPTTIYIGHPGWKGMGARAGYSILNGLFFTVVFLFGLGQVVSAIIPIEAGAPIVLYIGILISAQAFQATPREHAPAVALSLFPALAALIVFKVTDALADGGAPKTLADLLHAAGPASRIATLPGIVSLAGANSSWFVATLILTAMTVALIDRRYAAAAAWSLAMSALTTLGLLHAYRVVGNDIREFFLWQPTPSEPSEYADRGLAIAAGFAAAGLLFLVASRWRPASGEPAADAAVH